MKKCLILAAMLIVSMIFAFADTHLGRTENNVTDSSFIVQGYYKGEKENTSVTLQFKDINNQTIIHSNQSSTGTKVNASDSHIGSNTGTIFTWSMTGTTTPTTTLKFTFSTLQAEMNEVFYRPTYTLKMTINPTREDDSSGDTLSDTFYSNVTNKTQVVGGGTTTGTKATQASEFTGASTITYSGKSSSSSSGWGWSWGSTTWYRSGTCTLNIADYEQTIPGSYHYVCWVIAEYSIE
jgi:hypothetical protein